MSITEQFNYLGKEGVSYRDYQAAVHGILKYSSDFIKTNTSWAKTQLSGTDGRNASEKFEVHFVKPLLFESAEGARLQEELRAKTRNHKLHFSHFLDLTAEQENINSAAREWADIGIEIIVNQTKILVPVNIKYTSGKTSDNLCGWQAFSFLFFPDYEKYKAEHSIWKGLIKGEADWDMVCDYFLWSFVHGDGNKMFDKTDIFSLLGTDPVNFTFNNSQSFPMQAKAKNITLDSSNLDAAGRKKRIFNWLTTKRSEKAKAALDEILKVQASVERQLQAKQI